MSWITQIARAILKEEIDSYNLNIVSLRDNLVKNEKELFDLKYTSPKEEYYENKYPKIYQTYYKQFLNKSVTIPVQCFCGNYINKNLPTFTGTNDEKAILGLNWAVKNLTYIPDKTQNGLSEYWQLSYETLYSKKGDCEDGAILLYDILRFNKVPQWKLRITAGYALNPFNGKIDGHCYLTYYSETYDKWVALDWCYFPNIEQMDKQPAYKDVSFYGDVWWSFNEDYAWGKNKWN